MTSPLKTDPGFRIASALTLAFPLLLLWTVPADIALSAICALFLWRSWRTRDWAWCGQGWMRILAALWLFMIARGVLAAHPADAMARALPFIRYAVFAAALAHWTLAHAQTRRRFVLVLSTFVVVSALDGLLQSLIGFDLLMNRLVIVHSAAEEHLRLTGPFTKPILGVMLTWLAFPALLPLLMTSGGALRQGWTLLKSLVCLLAVLAAILLSGERVALLLLLMGCLLAAFLLPLRRRVLALGMGGILLLGCLALLLSPALFKRQIHSTAETLTHWQASPYGMLLASDLALAAQHPVIGLGTGQFRAGCEALYAGDALRVEGMCKTHPHNIYLEWLIENGVIGLGLFAAFVAAVLKGCARVLPRKRGNPFFTGLLIAFLFRVWPFISSTGFFSRWGAPPFWLVLGALLVYTVKKTGKDNDAGASLTLQNPGL